MTLNSKLIRFLSKLFPLIAVALCSLSFRNISQSNDVILAIIMSLLICHLMFARYYLYSYVRMTDYILELITAIATLCILYAVYRSPDLYILILSMCGAIAIAIPLHVRYKSLIDDKDFKNYCNYKIRIELSFITLSILGLTLLKLTYISSTQLVTGALLITIATNIKMFFIDKVYKIDHLKIEKANPSQ